MTVSPLASPDWAASRARESFELTPIQRGLLAESLLAPERGLNVEQIVWELDHVPDLERLRGAWQSAVDAFDALRLRFDWSASSERPVQSVEQEGRLSWQELDYSTSEAREQQARLEYFLDQDLDAGLELLATPLMRVSVLILGPSKVACVWTVHHASVDRGSYPLVLRHVLQRYLAGSARLLPAAEVAPPFADFLRSKPRHLGSEASKYFSDLLSGFDEPTLLPLQTGTLLAASGRTRRVELCLDASASARLRAAAEEAGTTPRATVQLAWAVLLANYSGQSDVSFGAVWSGRSGGAEQAPQIVGPFSTALPVRVKLTEAATVRDLLGSLNRQQRATSRFEHTGLDEIRAGAEPVRPAQLIRTLVAFEDESLRSELRTADARFAASKLWSRSRTAYALVLTALFDGDELELELEYDAGSYSAAAAGRLLGDFARLLARLGQALDESPLAFAAGMLEPELLETLTQREAERELVAPQMVVLGRILERARLVGERVAIEDPSGEKITYAELERRVLMLARGLRAQGVAAGVLVGVWMSRSLDSMVALLAVHAAGGAFVPLDPQDPDVRVEYVLQDCSPTLVLVDARTRGRLAHTRFRQLGVAELLPLADPATELSLPSASSPAYVIYTSGSTGQPKGVVVSQAALANHAAATLQIFELTPADRVLQFATLTFDLALEELMPTLAAGATLVLRSDAMIASARAFFAAVSAARLTVLDLPTAFWQQLVQAEHPSWPSCLRLVVVGGERVSPQSHGKFRQAGTSHLRWLNTYGPTEATIVSTYYDDAEGDHGPGDVPIGRPLPGVSHFVLDERLRPVPPGAVGQLYIGGVGLALGYLFREELTAARFIAHPWRAGARLYATGDRVRTTPSGNYVYVDRADNQVKVRGFRVELGEVEAQLGRHPAVREVAVVVRKQPPAEGALVGFVVADRASVTESELRRYLEGSLPAYMVPFRLVVADSLPMTLSGKVDRRALSEQSLDLRGLTAPASTPADRGDGSSIRALMEIWSEVLGMPVTSESSSFFDLGGHSLLVVRMFSEVERRLHKTCNVAAFFKNPTIAQLAGLLSEAHARERSNVMRLSAGSPDRLPLFFAPGLTGRAVDFVHLVDALSSEVPVYALQLKAFRDAERPGETLSDAVKDVVDMMQQVQPHGPYAVAGFSAGGVFAVAIAQELQARGERTDLVGLIDSEPPDSVPLPSPLRSPRRLLRLSRTVVGRVQEIFEGPQPVSQLWWRSLAAAQRSLGRWQSAGLKYRPTVQELFGKIPSSFSEAEVEAMQRYLDAIIAHEFGRLTLDLVLFRTPLDPPEGPFEPDLGWRYVTTGAVDVEQVPGRHGDLMKPSGCRVLAAHINAHLARRPLAEQPPNSARC